MSSLEILFPDTESVSLNGASVTLKPITLEHFEVYGKTASSLIKMLSSASVEQINRYAADHSADLRKILKVTTNLSWRQRRRLPATVAVQLLVAVVQANAGFFGEALPGMAQALNGAMSSSD